MTFAPRPEGGPFDLAVVCLPKGGAAIEWAFAAVSAVMRAGARVMVVGEKRSGIRSCRPLIERHIGAVQGSQSARHCVLIEARKTVEPPAFDGRRRFTVAALGNAFAAVSLPGVFSHGELDEGTAFLLDHLGDQPFTSALDWGCGCGVIGAALALANPDAAVDLVDLHVMALEAARQTLRLNGLDPERVSPSDIFSDVPGRYDLIVSNVPFHAGHAADRSVAERFIRQAPDHLTPAGRLIIVANAFLKYEPVLRGSFSSVNIIAGDNRYKVLAATEASSATRPPIGATSKPPRR